jgi:hypothetical protein
VGQVQLIKREHRKPWAFPIADRIRRKSLHRLIDRSSTWGQPGQWSSPWLTRWP